MKKSNYKTPEEVKWKNLDNSKFSNSVEPEKSTKVAVRRGCHNTECLCAGKCNEIIGWRDKLHGEINP